MRNYKSQGGKDVPLIECINHYIGKYRVRWDLQPIESDSEMQLVEFYETDFVQDFKPRLYDVKQAVLNGINAITDETILSGFVWQDTPIWLSSENQFNYKAAYDLATQTNGATLPVVFKFGPTENPVYHEFKTLEELSDFYTKAMAFISDTLAKGWVMKDSIDWEQYKVSIAKL